MESPRARIAVTGSACCQNRWLGSKLTPMVPGATAIRRSIVSGLYATKFGCISIATRTPADFAIFAVSFQYGTTRSFHCQSSASENSGGHGVTIQLGCLADESLPGQPLNVITVDTPSALARATVLTNVS